jgi:hypothetical protein
LYGVSLKAKISLVQHIKTTKNTATLLQTQAMPLFGVFGTEDFTAK